MINVLGTSFCSNLHAASLYPPLTEVLTSCVPEYSRQTKKHQSQGQAQNSLEALKQE